MSDRYKVIEGSESMHCCFEATVVDTDTVWRVRYDGYDEYKTVCECFEISDAQFIADVLNGRRKPQEAPNDDA